MCSGATGHAEAVLVTFDPAKVSYEHLLEEFWRHHDPTTPNRQGPDVGTQYRSAVFVHDAEQERLAKESLEQYQHRFQRPIVTEVVAGDDVLAGRGVPPALRGAHRPRGVPRRQLVGRSG